MIKETLLFVHFYETVDGGQSYHSMPAQHTLLSPAQCIETPLLPSHHRLPAHTLLSLGVLSLLAALLRGFFWCSRSLLKYHIFREAFFDLDLGWGSTVNLCHHALMVCFTTHDLSLFIVCFLIDSFITYILLKMKALWAGTILALFTVVFSTQHTVPSTKLVLK